MVPCDADQVAAHEVQEVVVRAQDVVVREARQLEREVVQVRECVLAVALVRQADVDGGKDDVHERHVRACAVQHRGAQCIDVRGVVGARRESEGRRCRVVVVVAVVVAVVRRALAQAVRLAVVRRARLARHGHEVPEPRAACLVARRGAPCAEQVLGEQASDAQLELHAHGMQMQLAAVHDRDAAARRQEEPVCEEEALPDHRVPGRRRVRREHVGEVRARMHVACVQVVDREAVHRRAADEREARERCAAEREVHVQAVLCVDEVPLDGVGARADEEREVLRAVARGCVREVDGLFEGAHVGVQVEEREGEADVLGAACVGEALGLVGGEAVQRVVDVPLVRRKEAHDVRRVVPCAAVQERVAAPLALLVLRVGGREQVVDVRECGELRARRRERERRAHALHEVRAVVQVLHGGVVAPRVCDDGARAVRQAQAVVLVVQHVRVRAVDEARVACAAAERLGRETAGAVERRVARRVEELERCERHKVAVQDVAVDRALVEQRVAHDVRAHTQLVGVHDDRRVRVRADDERRLRAHAQHLGAQVEGVGDGVARRVRRAVHGAKVVHERRGQALRREAQRVSEHVVERHVRGAARRRAAACVVLPRALEERTQLALRGHAEALRQAAVQERAFVVREQDGARRVRQHAGGAVDAHLVRVRVALGAEARRRGVPDEACVRRLVPKLGVRAARRA